MQTPEISIIVPVYNVCGYLERCISSIAAQTFGTTGATAGLSFEVIVVDDGSTDGSYQLVQLLLNRYAKHFSSRLISKANEGVSLARRDGLAVATGQWLAFVDSDDWLSPSYLELLYREAVRAQCEVVACGLIRTTDPATDAPVILPVPDRFHRDQDIRFDINTYPLLWNKLWRASLIDRWLLADGDFPGREVTLGEDIAITYPWIASAEAVSWIPDGLYFYRLREGSAFAERWTHAQHRRSIVYAIRHMLQECDKLEVLEPFRGELADISVLHLIRSNAAEIHAAMHGDAEAEHYCVSALSLLNHWFPDWPATTAQTPAEMETFAGLNGALVHL